MPQQPTPGIRPVRVLHALRTVRPTTNPYLVMLRRRLRAQDGVELIDFTYRTALFGRYEVFHLHWPEIMLEGSSPLRRAGRQALFALVLLRLRLTGVAVVRTAHNLERPAGLRAHEHWLLDRVDGLTVLRIVLNRHTPVPSGTPVVLAPHGHYRDWYDRSAEPAAEPGRIGYVGLIRRYKGVETLLDAFGDTDSAPDGGGLSLRVAGRPSSPELAASLSARAGRDPRVGLDLRFLTDPELVDAVGRAELVVLPYALMHNSGGTLAVLSLDRPVLVPDNEVNRELAEEVGRRWVHLFSGELTATDLTGTLAAVRRAAASARESGAGDDRPDLDGRGWDDTARRHESAYRAAVALRSGSTPGTASRPGSEADAVPAPAGSGAPSEQSSEELDPSVPLRLTVGLLCCRRNDELARSLPAVVEQVRRLNDSATHPGRPPVVAEVLVVDNDPEGSGADVVEPVAQAQPEGLIRYRIEPRPGIAQARNAVLDGCAGSDFLVFVDDDEAPLDGWLETLLELWWERRPAAIGAKVGSDYDAEPDAWVRAGRFYGRRSMPTGTRITASATNNLLIDLRQVRPMGLRFDTSLGLSGGEDTLFTRQIARAGGVLLWCEEAVVVEHVPVRRLDHRWLLARAWSHGNSLTTVSVKLADGPAGRARVRAGAVAGGVARIGGGLARFGLGVVSRDQVHRARGLRAAARGGGVLTAAVGLRYHEYTVRRRSTGT